MERRSRPGIRVRATLASALLAAGMAASTAVGRAREIGPAAAQSSAETSTPIAEGAKSALIDRVLSELRKGYVLPDAASRAEMAVRQRQRSGGYGALRDAPAFAQALTRDLQGVTHDMHLVVVYSADRLPACDTGTATSTMGAGSLQLRPEQEEAIRKELAPRNYGFQSVQILDGNVGYLNLTDFAPAAMAWDTAVAAMAMLANTDALIVDLRENAGGSPQMSSVLATYLFGPRFQTVHLSDVTWGQKGGTDQYWTLPYVPGKLYGGKDVYVLTSTRTFSAAEGFAYDLQALKRATVVGERTAGGAHVGTWLRLDDHFGMFVPAGRTVNPITGSNWEGVGVAPDVVVSAASALDAARTLALRTTLARETDVDRQRAIRSALARLGGTADPARR